MTSNKPALGPWGQFLRQCQNCYKPESHENKLSSCSGCLRCHYCSRECQKQHWPEHKILCKQNQEMKKRMKEDAAQAKPLSNTVVPAVGGSNAMSTLSNPKALEDALRPWIQIHRPTFQWALCQGLFLYRSPNDLDTHLLQIAVEPAFTPPKPPRTADPGTLFHITSITVLTFAELVEIRADLRAQFDILKTRSQVVKKKGGMGMGLILLICGPIVHFTPFGLEDPDLDGLKEFPNWQDMPCTPESGSEFEDDRPVFECHPCHIFARRMINCRLYAADVYPLDFSNLANSESDLGPIRILDLTVSEATEVEVGYEFEVINIDRNARTMLGITVRSTLKV